MRGFQGKRKKKNSRYTMPKECYKFPTSASKLSLSNNFYCLNVEQMLHHIITEVLTPQLLPPKKLFRAKQRVGCYFWADTSIFHSGTWSFSIWWKRTGQGGAQGGADEAPQYHIMNDCLIFTHLEIKK